MNISDSVMLRDIIKVHYGKALKQNDRNGAGYYHVFGSSGQVGFHDEVICDYPTLVIGRKGSVGEVVWAPKGGWIIDTAYFVERVDEKKIDLRYLFYALKRANLAQRTITTSIPGLNRDDLYDTKIPLPPLAEQKRIAAILDKADAIRRKRQQAIQLADDFLRSVFLDMFGDLVADGENKVKLGDVVLVDAPMVDPREEKYLDMLHIGPDRIEKNTGQLLPALTARDEGLISKKFLFDDRYVLYSKIRPYLKKCALAQGKALCSADMYPIRPVEGRLTKEFLWRLLLSDSFTRYTESLPDRANIPKLNRAELANFEFVLPDLKVQMEFSSVINRLNGISCLFLDSQKSQEDLFQSLSQKAFVGKL